MAELRVGRRAVHNFWRQLEEFSTQFRHLRALVALAGWDQETYMPPGAAQRRAAQLATAQKLLHRHMNSTVARRLALRAHQILPLLPERKQRIVSCFLREYRRYTALPEQLLEELSYAQTLALESWKLARRESDFSLFAPYLQRLLELKRQQIEFLGYEEHPYDALLGLYEPGLRLSRLQPMLQELTVAVRQLLQWVQSRPVQPSDRLLHQSIPADEQLSLARIVCRQIGFDEGRGRLDLSAHPFCTALGSKRCAHDDAHSQRRCKRVLLQRAARAGACPLRAGHPEELADSFAGEAVSMAIHESQSLLWEDIIGAAWRSASGCSRCGRSASDATSGSNGREPVPRSSSARSIECSPRSSAPKPMR
jgi:carboxypeptidase Taq